MAQAMHLGGGAQVTTAPYRTVKVQHIVKIIARMGFRGVCGCGAGVGLPHTSLDLSCICVVAPGVRARQGGRADRRAPHPDGEVC